MHGGGLVILCKKHILADKINLTKYNTPDRAELVGIEWGDVHWILYYTPNAHEAPLLLEAVQQYKEDHPQARVVYIGDMNVHNQEWLDSKSHTDQADVLAQEFSESFGMEQFVHFPTRGENTLDLVLSDIEGPLVLVKCTRVKWK